MNRRSLVLSVLATPFIVRTPNLLMPVSSLKLKISDDEFIINQTKFYCDALVVEKLQYLLINYRDNDNFSITISNDYNQPSISTIDYNKKYHPIVRNIIQFNSNLLENS